MRFRAECSLAGKVYGRPFGVDVAFGDPIIGDPEVIVAENALAFAGIEPPALRVYPAESHVAEKLHAYTMPRARPNSRVKDLPDLALLATAGPMEASRLQAAIEQTFVFRGTHHVPERLPKPPGTWQSPYAAIANEDNLQWATLAEVHEAARPKTSASAEARRRQVHAGKARRRRRSLSYGKEAQRRGSSGEACFAR